MAQRVPEYACVPLTAFLQYVESSCQLVDASKRSLSLASGVSDLFEAIAEPLRQAIPSGWDDAKHQAALKKAKETAAFAATESQQGFPFLHGFLIVGIWGALEATVEDLVVALLSNEPSLLQNERFSKIKIPPADYEFLEKEDRMRLIVSEAERSLRSAQRKGVDAFESLLECVGLSGPVSDEIRETFWEMNHVRNVIVHRRSCADRRFVNACPWLAIKIGEHVTVNESTFDRYASSLALYAKGLIYRLADRYGVAMSESAPSALPADL